MKTKLLFTERYVRGKMNEVSPTLKNTNVKHIDYCFFNLQLKVINCTGVNLKSIVLVEQYLNYYINNV